MKERRPYQQTWDELSREKAMVFMAGPRQAGKTTLARLLSQRFPNRLLFNWDIPDQRALFLTDPRFYTQVRRQDSSTPLIVLDEIHKFHDWKNYLKGVYDEHHEAYKFLVTGSGRLDLFRKGGDSLAGRYFLFRLWPFTISEVHDRRTRFDDFWRDPLDVTMAEASALIGTWRALSSLSGFPEPFLSGRQTTWRRWSASYAQQLIHEDIRDLTGVRDIQSIETLHLLLSERIGSPLSITSLSRDLKVSYNSVSAWIDLLERFYLCFSLRPWTDRIARAIQKERKLYLWDSPRIKDAGSRFENLVAVELYRAVTSWNDLGLGDFGLHFIKDKEQREVDFLISNDREPALLIEAKVNDMRPSKPLQRFRASLGVPAVQLVEEADHFRRLDDEVGPLLVAPAAVWLSRLA
jgi:uncharacterized protein